MVTSVMFSVALPLIALQSVQSFGVADLSTFLSIQSPPLTTLADGNRSFIGQVKTSEGLTIAVEFEKIRLDPGFRGVKTDTELDRRFRSKFSGIRMVEETHTTSDGATVRSFRARDSSTRLGVVLMRYPVSAMIVVSGPDTDEARERISDVLASVRVYGYNSGQLEPVVAHDPPYPWTWPDNPIQFTSLYEPPVPLKARNPEELAGFSGYNFRYPRVEIRANVFEFDPWRRLSRTQIQDGTVTRPGGTAATDVATLDNATFAAKPVIRSQVVNNGQRFVRLVREEGRRLWTIDLEAKDDAAGRARLKVFLGIDESSNGPADFDKAVIEPPDYEAYQLIGFPLTDPKIRVGAVGKLRTSEKAAIASSGTQSVMIAPDLMYEVGESAEESASSPKPKALPSMGATDEFIRSVKTANGRRVIHFRLQQGTDVQDVVDLRDLNLGVVGVKYVYDESRGARWAVHALDTLEYKAGDDWQKVGYVSDAFRWTWREDSRFQIPTSYVPDSYIKDWHEDGKEKHSLMTFGGDRRLELIHHEKWYLSGKNAKDSLVSAFRTRPNLRWIEYNEGQLAPNDFKPVVFKWRGDEWAYKIFTYRSERVEGGSPIKEYRIAVVFVRRKGKEAWCIEGDCLRDDYPAYAKVLTGQLGLEFDLPQTVPD